MRYLYPLWVLLFLLMGNAKGISQPYLILNTGYAFPYATTPFEFPYNYVSTQIIHFRPFSAGSGIVGRMGVGTALGKNLTVELSADCTYDLGAPNATAPWGAPTGSALDNCDEEPELTFSYSDGAPQYACGDAGGMTIERTHTLIAEDRCGNADTVTCIQTIVLLDVTGPVITYDAPFPQNIFGCLADTDTSLTALGALTATGADACGGEVTVGDCGFLGGMT